MVIWALSVIMAGGLVSFAGPEYLRIEDGVVWLWLPMTTGNYIYIYIYIFIYIYIYIIYIIYIYMHAIIKAGFLRVTSTISLWKHHALQHMMHGYILLIPMNQRLLKKLSKGRNISGNNWSTTHRVLNSHRRSLWFIDTSNV